jgi:hypothetical protein
MPENLLDGISPQARVVVAVFPFVVAIMIRMLTGRSKTADWLITLGTVWFAVSVLMAPFSDPMRRNIRDLGSLLP